MPKLMGSLPPLTLSDVAHARLEAMQLFEQSLLGDDITDLIRFIERQLSQNPPQLLLLRDLADDFQQRLEALRAHHADTREQVVRLLLDSYAVDITPLAPAHALDQYHRLRAADILEAVVEASADAAIDLPLLCRLIEASLRKAAQLQHDIELTGHVFGLLGDWLDGMSATAARHYRSFVSDPAQPPDLLH